MRVAIYSRVSTKDKGQTTENQILQLEEFAKRMGYTVVATFEDYESGGTSQREQFQAMFEAARRREFDLLLFWSLDRLSREGTYETLTHLQRLTSYGVDFRSYTEQFLDSCGPFRDAVISILATLAKQERVRLAERTRAGLARARTRGRVPGRPFKKLNEARIRELAHEGKGPWAIAKSLDQSEATIRRRMVRMGLVPPAGPPAPVETLSPIA